MQRVLLLVACALAPAFIAGAGAVSAQATIPCRPERTFADTLTITLLDAQRLALSKNPDVLSERQEIEIARGRLTQARVFGFNPDLELRAPAAGTNGTVDEFEAFLSQEIEMAGQRRLRIHAANFGLQRSEATVEDALRRTLANVNKGFFAALAAQQRVLVVTELLGLSQRLVEVTRIQAREGEISFMDASLAEIEAGRARARMLTAQREAQTTRLELQRLTGIPPEGELRLEADTADYAGPPTLNPDSLLSLALERRPDLVARTQAVEENQVLANLARREAIPNPRIGLLLERAERFSSAPGTGSTMLAGSPRVGFGVSLPIPLFQRNQGVVAGQLARAEQARYDRQATELTIRNEVMTALRAYQTAHEEVLVFERDVLQPARANQHLLDTAFQAGKVALPTMLLLRNQLLDAELGYWEAWLAARRALVDLQSATTTLDLNSTGAPR